MRLVPQDRVMNFDIVVFREKLFEVALQIRYIRSLEVASSWRTLRSEYVWIHLNLICPRIRLCVSISWWSNGIQVPASAAQSFIFSCLFDEQHGGLAAMPGFLTKSSLSELRGGKATNEGRKGKHQLLMLDTRSLSFLLVFSAFSCLSFFFNIPCCCNRGHSANHHVIQEETRHALIN